MLITTFDTQQWPEITSTCIKAAFTRRSCLRHAPKSAKVYTVAEGSFYSALQAHHLSQRKQTSPADLVLPYPMIYMTTLEHI